MKQIKGHLMVRNKLSEIRVSASLKLKLSDTGDANKMHAIYSAVEDITMNAGGQMVDIIFKNL